MPRPAVHAPRIAEDIRRRILSGELRPGTSLPGRRELAQSYGVAVLTLQRALAPLLQDGTLRSESTRGTYISEPSRGERKGRTQRIAIIAQAEADPSKSGGEAIWAVRVIRACEDALSAAGASTCFYNVMHHTTRRWWTDPLAALQAAATEGADALIALNPSEATGWMEALSAFTPPAGMPLVYACGDLAPQNLPTVVHDQEESGFAAATHCLAAGYQRLVALRPFVASWLDRRIAGARRAAGRKLRVIDAADGRSVDAFWNLPAEDQVKLLETMMEETLDEPRSLAFIAPSDGAARDMLPAIERAGIRTGEAVGLIGFDDTSVARSEGLTTMAPPIEELGAAAARLCLLAMRGTVQGKRVLIPSRVIARASTFRRSAVARV